MNSLKEWQSSNKEKMRAYRAKWRRKNPKAPALSDSQKSKKAEYQRNNPNRKKSWTRHNRKTSAKRNQYYADNSVKIKTRISTQSKSKEGKEKRSRYLANRKNNDIEFRLLTRLRSRLCSAVARSGARKHERTKELTGCSIPFLKGWLESQFKQGMTWANYGRDGWHIDHKLPCESFDLNDDEQRKECFHYTNLQPLWALENLVKGCKIQ